MNKYWNVREVSTGRCIGGIDYVGDDANEAQYQAYLYYGDYIQGKLSVFFVMAK